MLLTLLAGCARETTVDGVLEQVNGLEQSGKTDEAVAELRGALKKFPGDEEGQQLLSRMTGVLLAAGRDAEAKEHSLLLARERPGIVTDSLAQICRYYDDKGDKAGLKQWTAELTDGNLPSDLAEVTASWYAGALWEADDMAALKELIGHIPERMDAAAARRVLGAIIGRAMKDDNSDAAAEIIATIREAPGLSEELLELSDLGELELAVTAKEWDRAEALYRAMTGQRSETALQAALATLARGLRMDTQWETLDEVCEHTIGLQEAGAGLRVEAARLRVLSALVRKDAPEGMRRVESMFDLGFSAQEVFDIYRRYFYYLLGRGDSDIVESLLSLNEILNDQLSDKEDADMLIGMRFDAAFAAEDFPLLLRLLEQGIPGRNEDWSNMALNKIKAHQALAEGRSEEAVKRFRQFMRYVDSSWTQPQKDPTSGLSFTREMTLAFNAKRIGDILAKAGNTNEAARSYAEAAQLYQMALDALPEGSRERAHVEKEMADLPGTQPVSQPE